MLEKTKSAAEIMDDVELWRGIEDPDEIIEAFFVADSMQIYDGRIRRSILLALRNDIQFLLLKYGRIRDVKLNDDQIKAIRSIRPTFAVVALFCTGIDVLARAEMKTRPNATENGDVFRQFLITHMHLNEQEAERLWKARNGFIHGYVLQANDAVVEAGSSKVIEIGPGDSAKIYLNAMSSSLDSVSNSLYETLAKEVFEERQKLGHYLLKNGFYYHS